MNRGEEEAREVGRGSWGPPEGFDLFPKSSGRQLIVLSRSDTIRFVFTKAQAVYPGADQCECLLCHSGPLPYICHSSSESGPSYTLPNIPSDFGTNQTNFQAVRETDCP